MSKQIFMHYQSEDVSIDPELRNFKIRIVEGNSDDAIMGIVKNIISKIERRPIENDLLVTDSDGCYLAIDKNMLANNDQSRYTVQLLSMSYTKFYILATFPLS